MKFKDINFKKEIQDALQDMHYEELSPIQEKTLLPILENKNIVAIAETGSGKTSACGIPILQMIDEDNRGIQALVLVPTRELALQYVNEIYKISEYMDVNAVAVFGGESKQMQKEQIKFGSHILVATPGRLIDLLHDGVFDFRNLKTLVLDEADEMLNMGFVEDVEFIMSCIVAPHQILLFSATMPSSVNSLINKFLKKHTRIEIDSKKTSPKSLKHEFIYIKKQSEKTNLLLDFLNDKSAYKQVLIFCNSRFKGEELYKSVRNSIPKSDYLHGGMDQSLRSKIFGKFKNATLPILFATDVAGRGLDFSNVSHVINYDLPRDAVSYTHRTGRAGRMGKIGTAVSYVGKQDIDLCFRIIKKNNIYPNWIGEKPPYKRYRKH